MKVILGIFFVVVSILGNTQGYDFKYPSIPKTGNNKIDFIPQGWVLSDSVIMDCNKDSLEDIVLVLETDHEYIYEDSNYFNIKPYYPKMLVVLFKKKDNTYCASSVATKLFGKWNWGLAGNDAFAGIAKRRNTIAVEFLTGGTLREYITYYFRFQKNDWYLIGAESFAYHIAPLEYVKVFYHTDINFSTGEKEHYETDQNGHRKKYKKTTISKRLIKMVDFDAAGAGFPH